MVKPANAQTMTQVTPNSEEWAPFITIRMADGTQVFDSFNQQASQPLNLSLTAFVNNSPEGYGNGILRVSYVASWTNVPVVLYSWNGNPANLNDWSTNNSNTNPNSNTHLGWYGNTKTNKGEEIYSTKGPPGWVNYNLVLNGIPLGHQQITFTIVKAILYWDWEDFNYAKMESNQVIDFSVSVPTATPTLTPAPTPTPTITGSFTENNATLLGSILIVAVIAIGAGVLVYFKRYRGRSAKE
jgi:hypothetical protein